MAEFIDDPGADIQGQDSKLSQDSFFNTITQPTQGDHSPPPPAPEPKPVADPNKPDPLDELMGNHALIADLVVELLDSGAVIACKVISEEHDESLFKVPETNKKRIKENLALIFEKTKFTMNPYFIIVVLVIIAYTPMFSKAISLRKSKEKIQKAKEGAEVVMVPVPRKPGRPVGTTKS